MDDLSGRKVLIIYTGGTIGMQRDKKGGPLKPGSLQDMQNNIPELEELPYEVDWQEFKWEGEFIDSTNANPDFYNGLAAEIGKADHKYDGIVVVFGTDTMAPTASSISYMLEGLKKPVVFTGSMIPACDEDSDGPKNLIDAIHVAAKSGKEIPPVNEVSVCMAGKLLRGVKVEKHHAQAKNTFVTYDGSPLLAKISDKGKIEVNEETVLPPLSEDVEFKVNSLKPFGDVDIYPLHVNDIAASVRWENLEDIEALLIFGGRMHNDPKQGMIQENIQPDQLVVYAHPDPPESEWIEMKDVRDHQQAWAKLYYVLSRTKDPDEIKALLETNLRGEGEGPRILESEVLKENKKETSEPQKVRGERLR